MVFAGETIPFVLMPHFISPGQLRRCATPCPGSRACWTASATPTRRTRACATSSAPRQRGLADPRRSRLSAGDAHLPAGLLPHGYDLKFLEFNADSPAGIGYTDILYQGLTRRSTSRA